eukprot:Gregarina_sp_Pseudo_9__2899@NODE_3119_length_747_cov_1257_687853_g2844_i0_p1_GENE_NODE_3119_length_747_cov_1257_687853_g2844_i0NODE_3119_length_747_cov_1257_687853_g2844_i0_p1_ORF_typecomplete_len102_score4_22DNA_ligase_A_M/PF01068_21/0_06V_ATPase_I/PF01496_19/0_19_NODE_3119_length_747_cov_1257_687853_g2844_i0258563
MMLFSSNTARLESTRSKPKINWLLFDCLALTSDDDVVFGRFVLQSQPQRRRLLRQRRRRLATVHSAVRRKSTKYRSLERLAETARTFVAVAGTRTALASSV